MSWLHLKSWLKLTLPAFGGIGIFFSSLIDSSFVPLPLVTDVLLMDLSSRHPVQMPYYAAMAATGSLIGCVWIYFLARKGGQAYYQRKQGRPPEKIQTLVQEHPLACVFLPAVAPFPVPFKPFVIAQGVFQVPLTFFIVGTLLGRGCLFFFEGYLGAKYGMAAKQFLTDQKWFVALIAAILLFVFLLVRRMPIFARTKYSQTD